MSEQNGAAGTRQDTLYPQSGPVFIDTRDFVLRSLTPEDADERMLGWLASPEVATGLNIMPMGFDLNGLRKYIAGHDNRAGYLIGIFSKEERLLIGFYSLFVVFPHMHATLTSIIGDKNHVGTRVYWRTVDALLDYFYKNRGIYKIRAPIVARNFRMLFNFMQNSRFVLEAVLRNESVVPTGGRTDVLMFTSFSDDGKGNPEFGIRNAEL
ncbi:MAG: GNAT family N-acetyltransferase [Methylobacteriaceae bacterium]|jgi:RimJ/RimL family protein N-acetyltransferase|nr:GNAT family N-acetyltransferase [Methylobacteriaceae bacterium]